MKVELIDRSNGDLLAVNSARVSMAKHHDTFDPDTDRRLLAYLARENHFTPYTHARMTAVVPASCFAIEALSETERAGLTWAYDNGAFKIRHSVWGWAGLLFNGRVHGRPGDEIGTLLCKFFPEQSAVLGLKKGPGNCRSMMRWVPDDTETDPRFIDVTFRLTAPIPVVRQIQKTMVGLALNEVSRRYVDEAPTFDTPAVWRARPAQNIKQGSGGALTDWRQYAARGLFAAAREVSRAAYALQVRIGVAPEQARWSLLQAMETQGYFTYSLATLKRLYDLRVDAHAQAESGELVREMALAVACSPEPSVCEGWANL